MRISDWSSDVCSSDLAVTAAAAELGVGRRQFFNLLAKLRQLGPTRGLTPSFRNVVRKSVARDGLIEPLEIYLRKLLSVQPDARISQIEMAIIEKADFEDLPFPGRSAIRRRVHALRSLPNRLDEHQPELKSTMRISYALF